MHSIPVSQLLGLCALGGRSLNTSARGPVEPWGREISEAIYLSLAPTTRAAYKRSTERFKAFCRVNSQTQVGPVSVWNPKLSQTA